MVGQNCNSPFDNDRRREWTLFDWKTSQTEAEAVRPDLAQFLHFGRLKQVWPFWGFIGQILNPTLMLIVEKCQRIEQILNEYWTT